MAKLFSFVQLVLVMGGYSALDGKAGKFCSDTHRMDLKVVFADQQQPESEKSPTTVAPSTGRVILWNAGLCSSACLCNVCTVNVTGEQAVR